MSETERRSDSVTIELPQWPDSLPPFSRWKILIVNSEEEYSFFTPDSSVRISVEKNKPFCLIAQPLTLLSDNSESTFFKPAGFIYPWSAGLAKATWEEGFLSDVMAKFFRDGRAACTSPGETEYLAGIFNWKKAEVVIEKKIEESKAVGSEKSLFNPWFIDYNALLQNLSAGGFKQSLLNTPACATAPVCRAQNYYSSFVPENLSENENQQFTIRKNMPEVYQYQRDYGVLIEYKSLKNISLEFIFLPIYIEDI